MEVLGKQTAQRQEEDIRTDAIKSRHKMHNYITRPASGSVRLCFVEVSGTASPTYKVQDKNIHLSHKKSFCWSFGPFGTVTLGSVLLFTC